MAMLEVRGLVKSYTRRTAPWSRPVTVHAVDRVGFTVAEGEVLGLVGESGCGKTTTGRCVLRLIDPSAGDVVFRGESVLAASPARLRELRRHMQMVFQDPSSSLNPRMRAAAIVEEGLTIHKVGTPGERRARVAELFDLVGIDPALGSRYPREFSGGQRQRIGIARALALGPSFLVADEPVSALDVSVQAQVINLLLDLKDRLGLTILFIAHDLRLVRYVCQRVAVMYRGRIVEIGRADDVFGDPAHAYTRALLSAVPAIGDELRPPRVTFDQAYFHADSELQEVAPEHWALG
ncbi:MAG: ATP-binding cassette domain-containing protein [Vicinamibacterales bacterium]|nr:ATP-binding cassette domain-containing protein [Vicinamibacterales bacterium]